jgi:hypothetical protein
MLFGWSISVPTVKSNPIPTQRGNAHDPVNIFRLLNLGGKTAQELAIVAPSRIDSCIELMQNTEISISRSAAVVPDYPGTNATEPQSQANRIFILALTTACYAIPRKQRVPAN